MTVKEIIKARISELNMDLEEIQCELDAAHVKSRQFSRLMVRKSIKLKCISELVWVLKILTYDA